MLGEVALVDGDSRVGRTGLVFLNTLFDENAACHIAYGAAIMEAIEGSENAAEDELDALGFNNSTHPHRLHDRRARGRGRRPRRERAGGPAAARQRLAAGLSG